MEPSVRWRREHEEDEREDRVDRVDREEIVRNYERAPILLN